MCSVDPLGFTAAEIAWSLNHEAAYQAIFDGEFLSQASTPSPLSPFLLPRSNRDVHDVSDLIIQQKEFDALWS